MKKWFEIRNAAEAEAEVLIYDDIGIPGVGAEELIRELSAITAPIINVRINSYGGDLFDGFAIYNALKRHPARIVCHIDGVAASSATYAAIAGDEIRIAKNGMMMIHNPTSLAVGDAGIMRSEADLLDKATNAIAGIYVDRTSKTPDQVREWMKAETWFTAEECVTLGFVDVITNDSADPERVGNRRKPIFNYSAGRVPDASRVKALGLDDVLKTSPVNAATKEPPVITQEQFNEFAAKNPDAVKLAAKGLIEQERESAKTEALNSAKPRNATASELKGAFPGDSEFILERLDVDAPLVDHKLAYIDRLKVQNKKFSDAAESLRGELAKHDPASAGRGPVNTGKPGDTTANQPVSEDRRKQLLQMAGV